MNGIKIRSALSQEGEGVSDICITENSALAEVKLGFSHIVQSLVADAFEVQFLTDRQGDALVAAWGDEYKAWEVSYVA